MDKHRIDGRGKGMRKFLAVGIVALAMLVTPAVANAAPKASPHSPYVYKTRGFFCSNFQTGAQAKQWEYGRSGTNQFQQIYTGQVFYSGRWHNVIRRTDDSTVFPDDAGSHSYGYVGWTFTYGSAYSGFVHREQVVLQWWHRFPNRIVAKKTLYTHSCLQP